MKREQPWPEKWTKDWGYVAEKYPVFATELGFCYAADKGAHIPVISDESYVEAIDRYCGERGISWTVWCFDPHWSPTLIKDWTFAPTRQGEYFRKVLSHAPIPQH
jgi:endoglucanase